MVNQLQPRPENRQENLLPEGVVALLIGLEDRSQDLVFPEILSAPFVHEAKHSAPRREVLEEGVIFLKVLEELLVCRLCEFPFEALPLGENPFEGFPVIIS